MYIHGAGMKRNLLKYCFPRRVGGSAKLLIVVLIATVLSNAACYEKQTVLRRCTVNGYFTTVGNAPFTRLAFRADDGATYEVAAAEAEKLRPLQGRRLAVDAAVEIIQQTTVDEKYSRKTLVIKDIRIMEIGR